MTAPPRIPYRALRVVGQSGRAVATHGVKKGIGKLAAKAAPPLLILEAVTSVLGAVNSFIDLAAVRKHRDSLQQSNPLLGQRLETERKVLSEQVVLAKQRLEQQERVQQVLAELVRGSQETFRAAISLYDALLDQDLPDLGSIDEAREQLEDAWGQVLRAIEVYQSGGA